ncbi:MAG: ABC transporter ATP-binding protein [Clostridiales bacterium]|nr:ABC transporter ATP-binding protein [Clostridiales bacterium]
MLIIREIRKIYQKENGISGIDLQLSEGGIYSFIGPNGSGKTTLMNVVAGILKADLGEVLLDGNNTFLWKTKKEIGYALDDEKSYPNMTLYELLLFVSRVKYGEILEKEMRELLIRYSLWEQKDKLYQQSSYGMKKKLAILMSLLGNPKLILLDEPTNGVDTQGLIVLKEDLIRRKQKGAIILVTSHVLDFVETIATTSFFLEKGKIVKRIDGIGNLEEIYKMLYMQGE